MFPHNFFDASHITQQTEVTTTYNVKNVAAKVMILTMGLLLCDCEICIVLMSRSHGTDQNLVNPFG
jgi:ABC-type nickel/cobalt efflux system permease component RcnA